MGLFKKIEKSYKRDGSRSRHSPTDTWPREERRRTKEEIYAEKFDENLFRVGFSIAKWTILLPITLYSGLVDGVWDW